MRIIASFVGCALLSSIAWHEAAAAPDVEVELTARVVSVWDQTNILNDSIQVGDEYIGSYSYASTTPPLYSGPNFKEYHMFGPDATHMRLEHGTTVFETEGPNVRANVHIFANDNYMGADGMSLRYEQGLRPLPNGALIYSVNFRFYNNSGTAPITPMLPITAPDLQFWPERIITIQGELNGTVFFIDLQIDSVVADPLPPLEISPGKSRFHPQQRFDAMLLLPANSGLVSARASSNGVMLPVSYPGSCVLTAPNSQGRPAVLCQNFEWALPNAPEAKIDWHVELQGGAILENSVEWELLR